MALSRCVFRGFHFEDQAKSGCRTWGAGNILPAFGGTEAGIGKVHFTPNEPGEVLNEESGLPNDELGIRQLGPGDFGQTVLAGRHTRRNSLNTPLTTSAIGRRLAGGEIMNVFQIPWLTVLWVWSKGALSSGRLC